MKILTAIAILTIWTPEVTMADQGDTATAPLLSLSPTSFFGRVILTNGLVLHGQITVSNGIALVETATTNTTLPFEAISKLINAEHALPGGIVWPILKDEHIENESVEQGVAGYPPQGVGSPER